MAYTDIDKSDDYFNTKLYTGDGTSSNAITGVGFQPDFLWIKPRSAVDNHVLFDSVRGASNRLNSNGANAEGSVSMVNSFDSDGFTLNTDSNVNGNGTTYASWNWLADNTSGSSNTDGSITTTVSANTTSGFSIGTCTGLATNNDTLGHGLGVVPKMIIVKLTGATSNWFVYHASLGNTKRLYLNATDASTTSTIWNNTTPTSSVFTIKGGDIATEVPLVFYAFAEKKGFSKFGSYTGNGSTDGTFIYTGFKPAWVLTKRTNASAQWQILDNKRDTYNPAITALFPDSTDPDTTSYNTDFLSNGFKHRTTTVSRNGSGDTYIYMAFAENPFVTSTGIPATAR